MNKKLLIIGCAAVLTAVLTITSANRAVAASQFNPSFYPRSGTSVTVQFKADAVGQQPSPGGPALNPLPGNSLQGKLKAMDLDWIVLNTDKGDVFIPRGVVLLVRVSEK